MPLATGSFVWLCLVLRTLQTARRLEVDPATDSTGAEDAALVNLDHRVAFASATRNPIRACAHVYASLPACLRLGSPCVSWSPPPLDPSLVVAVLVNDSACLAYSRTVYMRSKHVTASLHL